MYNVGDFLTARNLTTDQVTTSSFTTMVRRHIVPQGVPGVCDAHVSHTDSYLSRTNADQARTPDSGGPFVHFAGLRARGRRRWSGNYQAAGSATNGKHMHNTPNETFHPSSKQCSCCLLEDG